MNTSDSKTSAVFQVNETDTEKPSDCKQFAVFLDPDCDHSQNVNDLIKDAINKNESFSFGYPTNVGEGVWVIPIHPSLTCEKQKMLIAKSIGFMLDFVQDCTSTYFTTI